jgi:hypothetical protein
MHNEEPPPHLFGSTALNVWREVYRGRWSKLGRIQRVEFVVEVVFFVSFFAAIMYSAYIRPGNLAGLALAFATVGAVLGIFFFLLTRSIR